MSLHDVHLYNWRDLTARKVTGTYDNIYKWDVTLFHGFPLITVRDLYSYNTLSPIPQRISLSILTNNINTYELQT